MSITIGKKVLITTDSWFTAPDGKSYQAVFGTVKGINSAEDVLKIKTNSKSTNWYVEVGNMTIAGCQIHYAIETNDCHAGMANNWSSSAEVGIKEYKCPSRIYFADKKYIKNEVKGEKT